MTELKFTDRYQALGIPYPDVDTMCKGQCEGTGWYPENDQEDALWLEAHQKAHTIRQRTRIAWKYNDIKHLFHKCDGWHFIKCPDCDGTGKAK